MKTRINRYFLPGAALAVWLLASGCSPQSSSAESKSSAPPASSTNTMAVAPESPPPAATVVLDSPPPPATPATLPSNVSPSSPLAQVIRLTQAGVDQDIILAFVTNSSRTFNLDSEKIIYLSDLGATTELITAIMQRDQDLQAQFAAEQAAKQAQQAMVAQPAPAAEPVSAVTAEAAPQPEPQPAPVTINNFYETLQPYGSWVTVSGYGNCWRPTVCTYNPGWQPYCDRGNWVYSDCGWYWNSDYAWGATFHYGRWFRAANVGWCWYPGTVWAPSWVTWRYSNNYCGWAPLPPRTTCQAGVGIVYNGGGVSVGFNFGLGANCYTFVPTQRFCDPHPRNYCVAPAQLNQVFYNTTVINNYNMNHHAVVNHGIDVGNISTAAHTPIRPMPVHDIRPGIAHYQHNQPENHLSQRNGANHEDFSAGRGGSPRTEAVARLHSPQPDHNLLASAGGQSRFDSPPGQTLHQHDPVTAGIPERSTRAGRNNPPTSTTPTQLPGAGFQRQSAPAAEQPEVASRPAPVRPNSWQNTVAVGQSRNYQPTANASTPPNQNQMTAANPQRAVPTPGLPGQSPGTTVRQPAAPATWPQAGSPRTYNNRPNAPQSTVGAAPSRAVQAPVQNLTPPRTSSPSMAAPRQSHGPVRGQPAAPSQAATPSSPGGSQWAGAGRPGH